MTPIREAQADLFDHPKLLTLDPARAYATHTLIANLQENPHLADVRQYIGVQLI